MKIVDLTACLLLGSALLTGCLNLRSDCIPDADCPFSPPDANPPLDSGADRTSSNGIDVPQSTNSVPESDAANLDSEAGAADVSQTGYLVKVVLLGDGVGRVLSDAGGIDCPRICSARIAAGNTIVLHAEAGGNAGFRAWSGACMGGEEDCALVADGDRVANAQFVGPGQVLWSRPTGKVSQAVVDPSGAVVVSGSFRPPTDLGQGATVGQTTSSSGFLAKYGSRGQPMWSWSVADTRDGRHDAVVDAIAMDRLGNFYAVLAGIDSQFDFGGGRLEAGPSWGYYVVKLSSTRQHLWSFAVRANSAVDEVAMVLAPDDRPIVDFSVSPMGPLRIDADMATVSGYGHFAIRYNGDGTANKTQAISNADVWGFTVDAGGNYFVAGPGSGSCTIGDKTVDLGPLGAFGGYVAKLKPDGTAAWIVAYPASDMSQQIKVHALALTPQGDVVATGEFSGTVNFGGATLVAKGQGDIFVLKLAGSTGTRVWSKSFGSADDAPRPGLFGTETGTTVAVDLVGNAYVGGAFAGTVAFGQAGGLSALNLDGFVLKLDPSGETAWARSIAAPGSESVSFLTTTSKRLLVAGELEGLVDVGVGTQTFTAGYLVELVP